MRLVFQRALLATSAIGLFAGTAACGHDEGTSTSATASHTSSSVSGSGGASTSASSVTSTNAGTGTASSGTGGALPMGARVRVVAANLTSGNLQSYDSGEGARILAGVHPDIILMQEMNDGTNATTDFDALAEATCGMDCSYVRGPETGIPNGIISRFAIVDSGTWTDALVNNRSFVWARLDVPGAVDCWAISVHLLTTSPTERASEGSALAALISANIPPTDFVVLGGDFNTKARDEPVVTALDPIFAVDGPFPADQNGNDATSTTRTRPYDWVLADDPLRAREIPVVIGQTTFANGAVIDTRVYQPIDEIAPALATDSGALNMQHMAVVKDFALQ